MNKEQINPLGNISREEKEENNWYSVNEKYENFKINKSKLGNYIVKKCPIHEPTYFMGMKVGSSLRSGAPEAYGVFRIDPYNIEVFPDQTYKVHLTPVGKLKDFMPNRAWYCTSIESSLKYFRCEYFEDPFEAQEYANKHNSELFPEYSEFFGVPKNLTPIQKIVKAVFKL